MLWCMRTTVRLDDQLLNEAKQHAAKTGRTFTALLEDALRTFLAMKRHAPVKRRLRLPTYHGGGLQPGIDLDNSADLLDVMERVDGTR